jgi:TIR domain
MPRAVSHVFISYVHDDEQKVRRLARELRQCDIVVWLDRDDLKPGQFWETAVNDAIASGTFFIACFSAAYVGRESTYMNTELRLAIDKLQERPPDREWFLPVLLSLCDVPSFPIGAGQTLKDLHYV